MPRDRRGPPRGVAAGSAAAASSTSCSTRAATLTAIAAGSFERMPSMPIGVDTRARSSSPSPASRSSFVNRAHFEREPMRPIEPRPGVRSAASTMARSSTWSWVMTSTCAPAGRSASAASGTGSGRIVTVATASAKGPLAPGAPIRSGASISARESTSVSSIGWRDRMRASSSPTWPIPKIATAGTTGRGSSSMVTSPPQHCTP